MLIEGEAAGRASARAVLSCGSNAGDEHDHLDDHLQGGARRPNRRTLRAHAGEFCEHGKRSHAEPSGQVPVSACSLSITAEQCEGPYVVLVAIESVCIAFQSARDSPTTARVNAEATCRLRAREKAHPRLRAARTRNTTSAPTQARETAWADCAPASQNS
eukprot:6182490-Pleurochrysis_carterae.AAC.3